MSVRRASALALFALSLAACAYANGYDPARYSEASSAIYVDPETEPLTPSPKRWVRDPRGAIIVTVDASAPVVDTTLDATAPPATANAAGSLVPPRCGSRTDPCPMQRLMHVTLETAHTPATLESAFTRVAALSPDPVWEWSAIATQGAALAREGDVARAKAQCAACHDAYRDAYRTSYRARKL